MTAVINVKNVKLC